MDIIDIKMVHYGCGCGYGYDVDMKHKTKRLIPRILIYYQIYIEFELLERVE